MPSDRPGRRKSWAARRLGTKALTARRAAAIISFFTLATTLVSAVTAFLLDRDDFPSIGLSIWWALQTLTTVGYGDFVPRNTEGRVIGAVVMLVGISFVAVVTAAITAALIEAARESPEREGGRLGEKLDEISTRLESIERSVARSRPSTGDGPN